MIICNKARCEGMVVPVLKYCNAETDYRKGVRRVFQSVSLSLLYFLWRENHSLRSALTGTKIDRATDADSLNELLKIRV